MKKGLPVILSILIHASIISFFLFVSGSIMLKHHDNKDIMSVSIEGDPNERIGVGSSTKGSQKNIIKDKSMDMPGINNNMTGATVVGSGEGGGTGLGIKSNYMGLVLKRIHSHKYYPIYAKKRGMTGIVKLKFTLKKDGTIKGNIEKLKSSGYEVLDDAGIKAIRESAPFSIFPEDIREQEINFVVDIDFVL